MLFEFILSFLWNFHTYIWCILTIPALLPGSNPLRASPHPPHNFMPSFLPFFLISLRVELTLPVSTEAELPCRATLQSTGSLLEACSSQTGMSLHEALCHPCLTLLRQPRLLVVHECNSHAYVQKILLCMSLPLTPGSYSLSKPSSVMWFRKKWYNCPV